MPTENTTSTLTDMQENAREFWRLAGSDFSPHYYVYSQLLNYQTTYGQNDFAEYQGKVSELLTGIGYGTDMETISEQFKAGLGSELGYWTGTYHLFDTEGKCYLLTVGSDNAILMLPTTTLDLDHIKSVEDFTKSSHLSSTDYQQGLLKLNNQQYAFELQFSFPHTEEKILDDNIDVSHFTQTTQPLCNGTVSITENNKTRQLKVQGKRGSYTLEGVQQQRDGDPIHTWVGRYMLYEIKDENTLQQAADLLEITHDDKGISLQWGKDIVGYDIQFNNNTLSAVDDSDPVNQYMLQFSCLQDGRRQLVMASNQEGFSTTPERKFIGYWLDSPAAVVPNAIIAHSTALKADVSTTLGTEDMTTEALPEQEINISTGSAISATLPIGVPGNPYQLKIKLTHVPEGAQYTWELATPTTKGKIEVGKEDPSSAVMDFQWASSDVSVLQNLTVNLKDSAGKIQKTLTLSIPVQNLPAITISPTTVPAIFRGNNCTINFSANGGTGLFTWEAENTPEGFSFDSDTQTLSGTANSLDTLSFKVKVSASKAIMNPGRFTISLQVQEPPALAIQKISYALIALGILGSLITLFSLPKSIYDGYKSIQKNRGDPTFEKQYKRVKLVGDSLKTSLDALGSKRFTHHIEAAIQFDSKYVEWLKNRRDGGMTSYVKEYGELIDTMNLAMTDLQHKIAEAELDILIENQRANPNQQTITDLQEDIERFKADENKVKADFATELVDLNNKMKQDYQSIRDAKELDKKTPFREKASKWIFGE